MIPQPLLPADSSPPPARAGKCLGWAGGSCFLWAGRGQPLCSLPRADVFSAESLVFPIPPAGPCAGLEPPPAPGQHCRSPHGHMGPQRDPLSPREAAQGLWSLSQRHPASPRPLPPPPGLISRPVPGSGMNKSAPLHNGDADFHRLAARAPRPHPGGATSVSLVAVPGAQPGSKHPQLGIPSLSPPPAVPGLGG